MTTAWLDGGGAWGGALARLYGRSPSLSSQTLGVTQPPRPPYRIGQHRAARDLQCVSQQHESVSQRKHGALATAAPTDARAAWLECRPKLTCAARTSASGSCAWLPRVAAALR